MEGLGLPLPDGWLWPQAKTKDLDFGSILVNSRQSRNLVLLNDGNCTLYYRLVLEQHRPEGLDEPPGTWAWSQGGVCAGMVVVLLKTGQLYCSLGQAEQS